MSPRVGDEVAGAFPVAGCSVPLRPGSWLVLSEVRKTPARGAYVTYFLGLVHEGCLKEGMRITSLTNDPADRYPAINAGVNELYNVTDENEANGSQSRWVIYNYIMAPWVDFHDKTTGISDIDSAAAEETHRRRLALPAEFLVTQFTRREPGRALEVGYYIDVADVSEPGRELATWRDSDFAPLNVRRHPRKFARFRELVGWASGGWPNFRDCFAAFQPDGVWAHGAPRHTLQ